MYTRTRTIRRWRSEPSTRAVRARSSGHGEYAARWRKGGVTHRDVAGVRAAAVARARWRLLSACLPPALCTTPASAQVGAVSANLIVAICPRLQSQPSYLCRRHFAPLSGGKARVRFLYFACARAAQVGGMCRLGGGGWRGGSARAARRVAHLGSCARAARRGWWWGRHLSRRAGHCAPSSRGRRHGGVGRAAWHERVAAAYPGKSEAR